jgi:hypothetical protein
LGAWPVIISAIADLIISTEIRILQRFSDGKVWSRQAFTVQLFNIEDYVWDFSTISGE